MVFRGSCWSHFISACSNQTRVPLGVRFTLFLLRKHLIAPLGCVPEFAEAMTASMHKLSLGDSFWSLGLQCFVSGVIRADWIPWLPTGWPVFSLRVVQSCIIGPRGDLCGEVVSCTLWVVLFSPSTCWKPNLKFLPVFFKPTCKSLIESHLQNISQVSGLCVWGAVSNVRAHPNPGLPRETGAILKAQQWAQARLSTKQEGVLSSWLGDSGAQSYTQRSRMEGEILLQLLLRKRSRFRDWLFSLDLEKGIKGWRVFFHPLDKTTSASIFSRVDIIWEREENNSQGTKYCFPAQQLSSCFLLIPHPGDFPGSPVVKTPRCQCRGHGFNPWSGN